MYQWSSFIMHKTAHIHVFLQIYRQKITRTFQRLIKWARTQKRWGKKEGSSFLPPIHGYATGGITSRHVSDCMEWRETSTEFHSSLDTLQFCRTLL